MVKVFQEGYEVPQNQPDEGFIINLLSEMHLPSLIEDQCKILLEVPSAYEIKHHFFNMKANTSLGPDGITTEFFKVHWDIVGSSTVAGIQNFFSTGQIAKVLSPQTINHLRPIGLCNTLISVY